MQAVAHNPAFAKKAGVPQSVGKEFTKSGGGMAESKKMVKKEVSFMKSKGAPKSMIKHEMSEAGMKKGGMATKKKAGKISEYGGKEMYSSKKGMMKHEGMESMKMEKSEGMKMRGGGMAAKGKGLAMKKGGMAPKGRGMAIMIAIGKPKGRGKS